MKGMPPILGALMLFIIASGATLLGAAIGFRKDAYKRGMNGKVWFWITLLTGIFGWALYFGVVSER